MCTTEPPKGTVAAAWGALELGVKGVVKGVPKSEGLGNRLPDPCLCSRGRGLSASTPAEGGQFRLGRGTSRGSWDGGIGGHS